MIEKNKQFIQEPATIEKCNELTKQLLYTRLASDTSFSYNLNHVSDEERRRQPDSQLLYFEPLFYLVKLQYLWF
ncbi:hypothetical protein MKW94_007187 [Papaver nudicaule]|uniref:Uncharacterized protein n=1 Tax=Papaver nudicaule TaxID=74823 RepID=A0AA41VXA5_PAPNU|nr:hypothetical protein [Papaver nudicaule]